MPKTDVKSKSKSTRKPLRDVPNGAFKSSTKPSKKKSPQVDEDLLASRGGDALDRLLLVHSDLSSLIHQIDELVVQALELKVVNKKERKEVEAFSHVLAEIQTFLKPWIPRFQKVLSNHSTGTENRLEVSLASRTALPVDGETIKAPDSPDPSKFSSLVSPSPLVSWRADCTTDGGRQLFLLTPLPRPKALSSKLQGSSKAVYEKITVDAAVEQPSNFVFSGDITDELNVVVDEKPTAGKLSDSSASSMKSTLECGFVSPEKVSKKNFSMAVSTPCLKMSPPKSCILLEPISEYSHKNNHAAHKSTPFPVGDGSQDSESSSGQSSEHLALKYPELFGIKPVHKLGNTRKVVEESPNWFMSPPKTCVLLEPSDEKPLTDVAIKDIETNVPSVKENVIRGGVCRNEVVESTPMLKDPGTTILRGKRAGENTLKKELWTRFEAATVHGIRFNASRVQETACVRNDKGFLDLLEEVSCDETNTVSEVIL